MPDIRTSSPPHAWNRTYHVLGAATLAVNKLRYAVLGYRRPRDFPPSQVARCSQYDFEVVENWMRYLGQHLDQQPNLRGKKVLELGSGQDLGVGLILLAAGVRKYYAVDAHNLLARNPEQFYNYLLGRLDEKGSDESALDELRLQLTQAMAGRPDRLNYICRKNFDLSVLAGEEVDFVFSQAAFEHFDEADRTIEQLNSVVSPGAVFLAVVDLQTHTRWFRDQDPLNIYRYSDFYYRLCRYAGQPNRLRPIEYREILAANGWGDIQIQPLNVLNRDYLRQVRPRLNERFDAEDGQMEYLTVVICATKE